MLALSSEFQSQDETTDLRDGVLGTKGNVLLTIVVIICVSTRAIGPAGLYLGTAALAYYIVFRLLRIGSDPLKQFSLVIIPVVAIFCIGWVWSTQPISVFQAREGPVYLGNVHQVRHYEYWACEVPLMTTTVVLILYGAISATIFVAKNRWGEAIAVVLIGIPVCLFNTFY